MEHIYYICTYIIYTDINICIMEYYSAIKNKILPFTTTRMDLQGIMLCKISQKRKDKYHMISLIYRI